MAAAPSPRRLTTGIGFARDLRRRCHDAVSRPPDILNRAPSHINVGSDCAGYGSDVLALRGKALGPLIQAKIAFYSDIDAKKRDMLELTHEFCGLTPPATRFKYSDVGRAGHRGPRLRCHRALRHGWVATWHQRLQGAVTFHCLDYMSKGHTNSGNVNGMARLAHSHEHSTGSWSPCLRALQYEVHLTCAC